MKVKDIIFQDFVNYKKPCMTIMMPYCTFKCDKECGMNVCQNSSIIQLKTIDIDNSYIIDNYLNDFLTEAIVFQGLEPFDSFDDMYHLIAKFTRISNDDIVIYTGYKEEEIEDKVKDLINIVLRNKLIIKYGRFIPNAEHRYDDILGVELASNNQYAKIVN